MSGDQSPPDAAGVDGLTWEVDAGIARLTLDRPDAGNALTPAMRNAIIDLLSHMREVSSFVVEVQRDELGLDEVILRLSLRGENAEERVREEMAAKLRVTPRIVLADREEIDRMRFNENERKPRLLIDRRQQ